MTSMPFISTSAMDADLDPFIADITVARDGKRQLRSSKPKGDGRAAYVWRMVAFDCSTNRQHHCMPITADFDLFEYYPKAVDPTAEGYQSKYDHDAIRAEAKRLDAIADRICKLVPLSQRHGLKAWGRAFGVI